MALGNLLVGFLAPDHHLLQLSASVGNRSSVFKVGLLAPQRQKSLCRLQERLPSLRDRCRTSRKTSADESLPLVAEMSHLGVPPAHVRGLRGQAREAPCQARGGGRRGQAMGAREAVPEGALALRKSRNVIVQLDDMLIPASTSTSGTAAVLLTSRAM